MNDLLHQLLDLDTLSWGAENARLGFERPIAAWGWFLIGLGALVLALWSYWKLVGPRAARAGLGVVRAGIIVVLALLITGPRLVQSDESIERDWVVVLVDRSASLSIGDVASDGRGRVARDAQLREAVERSWPMWRELSEERTVLWLGFDAGAFDLRVTREGDGSTRTASIDLGDADGMKTAMGAALDQALARAAARPLSAIVVLSDGRSIDEPTRAALRRLQSEQVPVHTVALGSAEPIGDYTVARAEAPASAFVGDVAPVRVELERAGGRGSGSGTVRLVERSTGIVLDERRVEFSGDEGAAGGVTRETVVLTTKPDDPGASTWGVEFIPDGPDLIETNNVTEFEIELVDRPMRVLYVDGYPRWEQRYLRNLLLREESIVSSGLLLAADRRYTQEGDIELDTLPDSPERWAEYDVVMIGDARPDVFTWDQLTQIRDHVSERGAGLVWIGGESQTPRNWWDTPLGDLLPFARDEFAGEARIPEPFVIEPTDGAERLGVMRLADDVEQAWPPILLDPSVGWSTLYWGQAIGPNAIKPTAEVLASARTVFTGDTFPLVMTMRYGAGKVVYVATDETWRYRYATGEVLFERFWLQLLRMLGRESLARAGRSAIITASPQRVVIERPVKIEIELLDQALVDMNLSSLGVRVVREPEPMDDEDMGAMEAELTLNPETGRPRVFTATWLPPATGTWRIEASEAELSGIELATGVEVSLPDAELRSPQTDHEALAALSTETGGVAIAADRLGEIAERLPNRQVRLLNERSESLWDTPLALIVVLTLLTVEWVGRRVIRLI